MHLPIQLQSGNLEGDDPQKFQNDEDHGDYDQSMDPISCFRKAWADVSAQKTEQPQDDENYDDGPKHEITPFDDLAE
jgi:hypothetical protein